MTDSTASQPAVMQQTIADLTHDRDRAYRLLDQTRAALRVALHYLDENVTLAPWSDRYKARAAELAGCRIALKDATEAVEAADREPTDRVSADQLADWLGRHEWYTHPEHPGGKAAHARSAHRAHHYDHQCAICRGDLDQIATVVLAYLGLGQPADGCDVPPTDGLAPVIAHQWSVRYPDGFVDGTRFTEAGARRRAAELGGEVVYRAVGPWQSAGTPDGVA